MKRKEQLRKLYCTLDPDAKYNLFLRKNHGYLRMVAKELHEHRIRGVPVSPHFQDNYDRLIANSYID